MPNWCDNYIHLEGPSEEVKKLQEDFSSKGMLETLSPIGEWEYMTAVNTWGTKWEISEDEVQHFEFYQDGDDWAHLSGPFQSAWSPPAEAVRTFLDNNPDFTATLMFYEPAMDFAGTLDESVTISDKSDDYWIMDPNGIELNEDSEEYSNLHSIGFDYSSKKIDKTDDKLSLLIANNISNDLIDNSFVNDEGIPILNDYEDKFDCLFGNNYHIRHKINKNIYYFTLKDLLEKLKVLVNENEIMNKKIFYGIVNKYFPNIKDIKFMEEYDSFSDLRDKKFNEIVKYITYEKEILTKIIRKNNDNLHKDCDFNISLLKFYNTKNNDNRINIINMFCNISKNLMLNRFNGYQ